MRKERLDPPIMVTGRWLLSLQGAGVDSLGRDKKIGTADMHTYTRAHRPSGTAIHQSTGRKVLARDIRKK